MTAPSIPIRRPEPEFVGDLLIIPPQPFFCVEAGGGGGGGLITAPLSIGVPALGLCVGFAI